jgi:FAD synthase
LLTFIRPEKKFNSLSELKDQIEIDTQKACDFHKLK